MDFQVAVVVVVTCFPTPNTMLGKENVINMF